MTIRARVSCSLQIDNTDTDQHYSSRPTAFNATVEDGSGPTPGLVNVPVSGVDIDLSAITNPGGLVRIQNLSTTNYVEVGSWDGAIFRPLFELLPGEFFPWRLSRNLGNIYGTGTGTSGTDATTLRLNANTSMVPCLVEAFNK